MVTPPVVSLVLTGRNDGYGGDFIARFFRSLRFNHQQLTERGIAHELVFVEWAPPSERTPDPRSDLRCDPGARCGGRVPGMSWTRVTRKLLSLNPRLEYLEFPAKNVGVRRARGRFVLTSNCDVYFGRRIFECSGGGHSRADACSIGRRGTTSRCRPSDRHSIGACSRIHGTSPGPRTC